MVREIESLKSMILSQTDENEQMGLEIAKFKRQNKELERQNKEF